MNSEQKIVLLIGIVIFALMGIFPPWVQYYYRSIHGNAKRIQPIEYAFLGQPPNKLCQIDTSRLYVQWSVVAVTTGGLICFFAGKKDKKPKDDKRQTKRTRSQKTSKNNK